MIATSHPLASVAGLQVLREGGSAADAAIAASAVLCVTSPHATGPGGDAVWLLHAEAGAEPEVLDAVGPAARAATGAWARDRAEGGRIPRRGGAAALTVPGLVDGWREAHGRHGRLRWERLFDDAIHHAAAGVPVSRALADAAARRKAIFSRHPLAARLFTPGGRPLEEGELIVQSEVARTLERIAHEGGRAFYEGEIAERICAAVRSGGSPLHPRDFRDYRAAWVKPLPVDFRGRTAWAPPPPSHGLAALQLLGILGGFDAEAGEGGAPWHHRLAEASKLALADRAEWLADPVFVAIPLDRMLTISYLNRRRSRIREGRALEPEEAPPGLAFDATARRTGGRTGAGRRKGGSGRGGRGPRSGPGGSAGGGPGSGSGPGPGPGSNPGPGSGPGPGSNPGPGSGPGRGPSVGPEREPPTPGSGDTCGIVVADASGMVLALVQSIHDAFGCGEVAGETGVLLQNRAAAFSLDETRADRLEPGKRPAHALAPLLLLHEGRPSIALAATGGDAQPQACAAIVERILDAGFDVQQAIEAPRAFVHRAADGGHVLALEGGVPDEVARALALAGHSIRRLESRDVRAGEAQVLRIDRERGVLEGGADPRGEGAALAF